MLVRKRVADLPQHSAVYTRADSVQCGDLVVGALHILKLTPVARTLISGGLEQLVLVKNVNIV